MKRIYNFSAGPAILPVPVLEEASRGVLEIADSGMSILEVSHRGKQYEAIHFATRDSILRIHGLDKAEYDVLFLGGGASLQFLMIPMNFLSTGETADYIHTGEWSAKAIKEAKRYGTVNLAGNSEPQKFAEIGTNFKFSPQAKYAHITLNNTIEGTQFASLPETSAPLIADASSEFMSRKLDYKRFSLLYAGAQKNAGPAGVTIVVIRRTLLETAKEDIPTMLSYKTHAKADSLYNTPPAFSIYVVGLVAKWIESQGGLEAVEKVNQRKAQAIYSALDGYPDVYEVVVSKKPERSLMNITFRMKNPDKEKDFLAGARALGMDGLKGHRSVGGLRASIYNAFPEEGALKLAEYIKAFAKK